MKYARHVLHLFVSGSSPRSLTSINNIRRICQEHLKGWYKLEVIDIYQQPERVAGEQVFAAPTLVKQRPLPPRRTVGDLSDHEKVLLGLDLKTRSVPGTSRW